MPEIMPPCRGYQEAVKKYGRASRIVKFMKAFQPVKGKALLEVEPRWGSGSNFVVVSSHQYGFGVEVLLLDGIPCVEVLSFKQWPDYEAKKFIIVDETYIYATQIVR